MTIFSCCTNDGSVPSQIGKLQKLKSLALYDNFIAEMRRRAN